MYSSCMHCFGGEGLVEGCKQEVHYCFLDVAYHYLFFFFFIFTSITKEIIFTTTAWVILKSPIWNLLSLSKKAFYTHYLHGTTEKVLFCLLSTITDNIYWPNIIVQVIGSLRKARRHLQNISEAQIWTRIVSNVVSIATIKWQL